MIKFLLIAIILTVLASIVLFGMLDHAKKESGEIKSDRAGRIFFSFIFTLIPVLLTLSMGFPDSYPNAEKGFVKASEFVEPLAWKILLIQLLITWGSCLTIISSKVS